MIVSIKECVYTKHIWECPKCNKKNDIYSKASDNTFLVCMYCLTKYIKDHNNCWIMKEK